MIGVPDDTWGERVVAYIQPRPGETVDRAALRAWCVQALSGFKRPTETLLEESIPKNAVGKIDKAALRAAHALQERGESDHVRG